MQKPLLKQQNTLINLQEGKTPILFKKDEGLIGEDTRRKNCQE